jgi:hypothetical protein
MNIYKVHREIHIEGFFNFTNILWKDIFQIHLFFPATLEHLTMFIAHCFDKNLASSTVLTKSYVIVREKCNTFVPQLIAPYFNGNYNREKFLQSNVITLPIIVPSNSKPLSSKNMPKT